MPAHSESELLEYVFKSQFLTDDHPLNLFYAWLNEHPELQLSQERCDRMTMLCSDLPQVQYLKSSLGKDAKKDYEVSPGLINLLNLFRSHFMTPLPAEPLSFEGGEDMIRKEFDALCLFLSRENFKLTWAKDALSPAPNKKEYFGTLTFFINGKETFNLVMEDGHGHIKYSSHLEESWRQGVDVLTLKDTLPLEILSSFLSPKSVGPLFESLSTPDQIRLAYSLKLNSSEMKLSIIKESFTHNRFLIPFSKKLMRR
ncbi:MAG: hypothetical protein B7Y25_04025 [Alphaproteobacteria bacterium 16-39-46]|nr:MAG: hypothetical protein B7Y25_04025 [Alphaproteobacteria bacterium 16-39-46]OZA43101.1 MAG: hypothetical protein B7X84_04160 [Alphaproteobacteria bacterium 17-39-52]HQS84336.1 hypothetical protein [Alphaproteobacteria bacterium]HQS93937.1 hypothetical protein [Alphaproteobacteria bacterium]